MLRSMGRAPGDVAVDGGAEKVCEPRLPKLPPRPARASASVIANANTPATAQSASSGRTRKESMKSSQKDRLVPPRYWYPLAALEEVPHGACRSIPLVPAKAGPRIRMMDWISQHKRVHARLDALCAGMSGGPWPAIFPLELPKNSMVSVVLAVGARLGHGQGALAPFFVGVKAPPLRRRPARCERAGDPGVVLDRVSRGARGDLFARHGVRVARAMAVAPTHQIDVDMVVVIDVRAGRQHRAELIAGRGLHVAQKTLLLRQAAPAVLHRDLASVGERERRDVERVAEGVLGNARHRIAVHAATGIRGDLFDLDNRRAEPAHRRRLYGAGDPTLEL